MNRQVFRYRTLTNFFLAGFLTVWSVGWLSAWGSVLVSGTVNINHVVKPVSEEMPMVLAMLSLGVAIGGCAVAAWLFVANARVEVEDGWISSFDLLGRRRVRGGLFGCKVSLPKESSTGTIRVTLLQTDAGDIKVYGSIAGYGRLLSLIDGSLAEPVAVTFQPEREVYDYRWRPPHLFSFFFIALVLAWCGGVIATQVGHPSGSLGMTLLMILVVAVVFGGVGTYLQLQGWNAKVIFKDGSIVWIDCLGKVRRNAPYGSVLDVVYSTGGRGGASLKIVTLSGDIFLDSNLRGFQTLRSDMARLITEIRASRGQT